MKTLFMVFAVAWLCGFAYWVAAFIGYRRAQNRRGGRLMRFLVINTPRSWR